MSDPSSDLAAILRDLADGRIDAAEAQRRIHHSRADESSGDPGTTEGHGTGTGQHQPAPTVFSVDASGAASPDSSQPAPTTARAALADEASATRPVAEASAASSTPTGTGSRSAGAQRLVVRTVGRRVRIIGDASVATVAASGPHTLRRQGNVLEVTSEGDLTPSLDGLSMLRPPRSLGDLRSLLGGKELVLRVNPDVVVDAEVTAGSLNGNGVPRWGDVRVTAATAGLGDVAGLAELLVQAGAATVHGTLARGRSRMRVESGQLTIDLADDANVTVRGDSQLGRIAWPGEPLLGSGITEYVAGNGAATLDLAVVMGNATIRHASAAAHAHVEDNEEQS